MLDARHDFAECMEADAARGTDEARVRHPAGARVVSASDARRWRAVALKARWPGSRALQPADCGRVLNARCASNARRYAGRASPRAT